MYLVVLKQRYLASHLDGGTLFCEISPSRQSSQPASYQVGSGFVHHNPNPNMPPRIPGVQRLGTFSKPTLPLLPSTSAVCLRPAVKPPATTLAPSLLPITQTASMTQKEKKRLAKQDPYRWAQIQQRKAAHLKIRERIEAERASKLGDPIRGFTTPFVESFDSAGQTPASSPVVDSNGHTVVPAHELPTSPHILNYLIRRDELEAAVENARQLTEPLPSAADDADPDKLERERAAHAAQHAKAVEVLRRITHLDQGSAADRRHANIQRCIETFGRHKTDGLLRPKPLSRGQVAEEKPVRGGPDTGSSEVQIAILTAKIRTAANQLEKNRGYKDKVGKRDLRLMVHKRQKLLRYMHRKERGSERWKHMVETLGLSEATWKGQITV
ncbi:hypothetical protein F4775DRAFT_519562 [Biscogniauxia sp. FL1348]|nr:hypothetical protein F4775DRAFT_519562 [Biscogniauxia sp. FL1348]